MIFSTYIIFATLNIVLCNSIRHYISKQQSFNFKADTYITSEKSTFGPYIEGASVNAQGDIFAVNYGDNTTLHQLGSISNNQIFYKDNDLDSWFNAIRFVNEDKVLVGDARLHRVLKIDQKNRKSAVFCEDKNMLQPNDMTITSTGLVYTSGMRFVKDNKLGDGDIWLCSNYKQRYAKVVKKVWEMGRCNGIEVSPDESYLYASESMNKDGVPVLQKVWKFGLDAISGDLTKPELFIDFDNIDGSVQYDIDGMRTDIYGNLYITRHGYGKVMVFNNNGVLLGQIQLNIIKPTNIEFGGKGGNILFIVGQCPEFVKTEGVGKGCVDYIQLDVIGKAFYNLNNEAISNKLGLDVYQCKKELISPLFT